jgi:hopene-associated glycosyltransferase HpnB
MMALLLASISCAAWVYLLAARGGFWRASVRDDVVAILPSKAITRPRVIAVVPARDEAELITGCIGSLLNQDYGDDFSIIVVDDHSVDGTALVARNAAKVAAAPDRVVVLAAPILPDGWTGKLWALNHGVDYACSLPEPPDYILLTDADIRHAVDMLTNLVARAIRDHTVLTSLMSKLRCETFGERAMIPAFIFFFQMLYPFAWVKRVERSTAAAAGGCVLVHRRSLQTAGGLEAIRDRLIDDCALARLLKSQGPIWLGLTERARSVRAYPSFGEIRRMIVRTAFAQLEFSPWWLALTVLAMAVTYIVPPALTLFGSGVPQLLGAMAWAQMTIALQPTLRFYRVSPLWGLALPAIATAYLLFTIESAYRHLRGREGKWKVRVHWRI